MSNTEPIQVTLDRTRYDHANADRSSYKSTPGVTAEVVREISRQKNEPAWMLEKRLKALELFQKTPLPTWGPDLSKLNLDEIVYFVRPDARETTDWAEVPPEIKKTLNSFTLESSPNCINKKDVTGILGPNAIGKTTFMKIKDSMWCQSKRADLMILIFLM